MAQEKMETKGDDIAFSNYGLTKREYFAALAMKALLANPEINERNGCPKYQAPYFAVELADILIKALNK
ncbi:MAG: hypothetical protein ACOVNU_04000 [Candidatus Kapaibacteriota bacterium]